MKTHKLTQGSAEWLAYRAQHFNASDAPAMMGCSAYKTRSQLLHEMHTGLSPEVDAAFFMPKQPGFTHEIPFTFQWH